MSPKANQIYKCHKEKGGGRRKEVIGSRIDPITLKQTEKSTRETKQLHVCCPTLLSGTTEKY